MPTASGNLYSDAAVVGFSVGDSISLVSQVGAGTWTANNNGDISYTPPTPDTCEAVSATFEIQSTCCCDQFTVSFAPICCDLPTASITCPSNVTDWSTAEIIVSGSTPNAGASIAGTLEIRDSTNTLVHFQGVSNPSSDTITFDFTPHSGEQMELRYVVSDDCESSNIADDTCIFTVPCLGPTAEIVCSTVSDPSSVTVSWTASPSGNWTLNVGGIEILDGTALVGFHFVPFGDLGSGSHTFDLTGQEGKTLTARYTVAETCGGSTSAVDECTLVIPCDLPTATVDCSAIGTYASAVMISVTGASPHGSIVSGTLEIVDSTNMVVASAMPANPANDTETLNLTGLEGQSLTARYFVEDDCGAGGTSVTVDCPFDVPSDTTCENFDCPTVDFLDCDAQPRIQFLIGGSEYILNTCPEKSLIESVISALSGTGVSVVFLDNCQLEYSVTLADGSRGTITIDASGTTQLQATVQVFDTIGIEIANFEMTTSGCNAPWDLEFLFYAFTFSGTINVNAACFDASEVWPTLQLNSDSSTPC